MKNREYRNIRKFERKSLTLSQIVKESKYSRYERLQEI